jgi:hypothetical protein
MRHKHKRTVTPAYLAAALRNLARSPMYRKVDSVKRYRSVKESHLLRSLVWQDFVSGRLMSVRKLAKILGCENPYIVYLRREFRANPARQLRREETFGPATLEQLNAERAKRENDWENYRRPRIKRPAMRPDPVREERERQLREFMRKPRMKKFAQLSQDYGHEISFDPDFYAEYWHTHERPRSRSQRGMKRTRINPRTGLPYKHRLNSSSNGKSHNAVENPHTEAERPAKHERR